MLGCVMRSNWTYKRNQVVNVKFTRHREGQAIVITVPGARSRRTGAARHETATVALQDGLSGVASAADCDPVVEEIAVICRAVTLGFDGQLRQVGPRGSHRDGCRKVSATRYGRFNGGSEGRAGSKEDRKSRVESHW